MNAIAIRATIADIAQSRDKSLMLYSDAHDAISTANGKMLEAELTLRKVVPGMETRHFFQNQRGYNDEEKVFGSFAVAEKDDFMKMTRRMVDTAAWKHVMMSSKLGKLMDKKAKDEFTQRLLADPPEFTEDAAFDEIYAFQADSSLIFKRGLAEAFSNLDRRFRSHTGWKIGSRIILSYAFDSFGHWLENYSGNVKDTLQDIERSFLVLDRRPAVDQYAGIVGEINEARWNCSGARQTEIESEFYTVRIFKNGNIHLWFKRPDLVEKANKMIGEYYGEGIPTDRDYDEEEVKANLNTPKRVMAKNYGFFPTPDALADATIEAVSLRRHYSDVTNEKITVLEPSAGSGQLSKRAVEKGAIVDCIEYQPELAASLKASGIYNRVLCVDFLDIKPETIGQYDRVVMNPPFDRERDIDHVIHALKFVKPCGKLVSIMSAHTEFAESKKAVAFRAHIAKLGGKFRDNPRNSFSSVGTNVNTITLTVDVK